jgi:hypothetical protein
MQQVPIYTTVETTNIPVETLPELSGCLDCHEASTHASAH